MESLEALQMKLLIIKLIAVILLIIGWLFCCYLLMRKTPKGKRLFLYMLSGFLVLNISNLAYSKMMSKPLDVSYAVYYILASIAELLTFMTVAVIVYFKNAEDQQQK